ncbi:MAG: phosphotransferase enzyme family protein [Anaerolineales bacterium]
MAFMHWEYRQARPSLDAALVGAILERWGLSPDFEAVQDLGGAYNRNGRVQTLGADVVVRIRPPWLTLRRVRGVHRLLHHLAERGIATPLPRTTLRGETIASVMGYLVEVYDYLPEAANREWSPARWGAAFAHLGRLHRALARLEMPLAPPLVSNYAAPHHLQAMLLQTLSRLEALPPSPDQAEALAMLGEALRVAARIDMQRAKREAHLPRQLIHGDFHLDNLLFGADGDVRYTLDFDFAAVGERVFDVAYALRLALPQLTDNPDCMLSSQRVSAWLAAYDAGAPAPLSPDERAMLPYELAAIALYHIADACRVAYPLGQVLREVAYLELAVHLADYPDALLNAPC